MRLYSKFTGLFTMCFILSFLCCAHAGQTNAISDAKAKVLQVKTNFEADAILTSQEVNQVISLAKQCGIGQPAEISTFHYLPSSRRGVAVKSVELVKGADITFDEITIGKIGWTDINPTETVKRVGSFWATPSDKFTTHLRVYDFRGERIRVDIRDGVTIELADKIIPLIASKKVRYPENGGDYLKEELKKMISLKPGGIAKPLGGTSKQDGELWLHFEGQLNALQFHFEKGEVILENVIIINVERGITPFWLDLNAGQETRDTRYARPASPESE